MAERGGFEPPEDFHPRRFSKPLLSTTQPSLLVEVGSLRKIGKQATRKMQQMVVPNPLVVLG